MIGALLTVGCTGPIEDDPANAAQAVEAPPPDPPEPGHGPAVATTAEKIDDTSAAERGAERPSPPPGETPTDLKRENRGESMGFAGAEHAPDPSRAAGSEDERRPAGDDEAGSAGRAGIAVEAIGLGRPGVLGRGASGTRLNDSAGRTVLDAHTARFGSAGRSGGGPTVAPMDPMGFGVTPTGPAGDDDPVGGTEAGDIAMDAADIRGTAGDRVALLHHRATRVTTHRVDPGPRSRGGTVSSAEGDRGALGPVAGSLGLSPPIRLYRFRADPDRGLAAHPRECHPTEILRTLEGEVNDAGGPCTAQVTEVPQAGIELASVTCFLSDPTPGCRRTYVGTVWVEHQAGSFYDYELRAFGRIARQCRGRVEGMSGPADRRVTRRSAELDALFDRCGQKLSASAGATSSSSEGR